MYLKKMKAPAVVMKKPDLLKKAWKKTYFHTRTKGGADAGWNSGRTKVEPKGMILPEFFLFMNSHAHV